MRANQPCSHMCSPPQPRHLPPAGPAGTSIAFLRHQHTHRFLHTTPSHNTNTTPGPPLQGQQPPPISFLRHPRIFEVLLHNLFSPGRQLQPEAVQAYSGLLALAAAADDRRLCGPADGAGGSDGAAQQQHQAGDGGSQQQQQQGGDTAAGGSGLLDLSAVPATRAALEAAAELAQRVMQDQKSSAADMDMAASVLEYPCCAAGALSWRCAGPCPCPLARKMAALGTRPAYRQNPTPHPTPTTPCCVLCCAGLLRALGTQLSRPEYWQTAYHLLKSPPFLELLSLMVPRQPALHGALLQLLGRALTALGNSNHDMAKGFLSIAVQVGNVLSASVSASFVSGGESSQPITSARPVCAIWVDGALLRTAAASWPSSS